MHLLRRSIMETQSLKRPPSPSSPDKILISPESFSHHSSPSRSARTHRKHHVTIDESRLPMSLSTHHQLVAALAAPAASSENTSGNTGHLALLYHSSSHHHHLHPILPVVRRPSRLPETVYVTRPQEIRA